MTPSLWQPRHRRAVRARVDTTIRLTVIMIILSASLTRNKAILGRVTELSVALLIVVRAMLS